MVVQNLVSVDTAERGTMEGSLETAAVARCGDDGAFEGRIMIL